MSASRNARSAVRLDPQPHVTGEVTRDLERRHAVRELRLARDLLELDRCDRARDVRPVTRARKRDAVAVRDVARVREDELAVAVRVPADVVDVEVRQKDDVDVLRREARAGQRGQQTLLPLRLPAPQPRRADTGIDENGRAAGPDQIRRAGDAPLRAVEELGMTLALALPVGGARKQLLELPQPPHRVGERHELDRADYHRRLTRRPTGGFEAAPARRAPPASRRPGSEARRSARSRPRSRRPA